MKENRKLRQEKYTLLLERCNKAADSVALEQELIRMQQFGIQLYDRNVMPEEVAGLHYRDSNHDNESADAGRSRVENMALIQLFVGYGMAFRAERERRWHDDHQRLFAALGSSKNLVVVLDTKDRIRYINPALEYQSGLSLKKVQNKRLDSLYGDATTSLRLVEGLLATQEHRGWSGRVSLRNTRDEIYWVDWTFSQVLNNDGDVVSWVGIGRDVTEVVHIEREKKIQQKQKIDAVATLAGGISHHFNNLLQVIHGLAEVNLELVEEKHSTIACNLKYIVNAADEARGLVRQMLDFSRDSTEDRNVVDLKEVVESFFEVIKASLSLNVELTLSLPPEPCPVEIDVGQIQQVILNLVNNAAHAMKNEGGVLSVKIIQATQSQISKESLDESENAGFICLTVTDTGHGIPPEYLSHMFEPFFTTKPIGHGTGLGLATAYGIVRDHDGWIDVDSKQGKGAVFSVFLPIYSE